MSNQHIKAYKPIGLQLREKKKRRKDELNGEINDPKCLESDVQRISILSLEEQIAQLQKNLGGDDNEDSDDSNDNEDNEIYERSRVEYDGKFAESGTDHPSSVKVERDGSGKVVRLVSSIQDDEKILPLPGHLLPAARCSNTTSGTSSAGSSKRRVIRFSEESSVVSKQQERISGMEKTVREMLESYTPASVERKPFFCRICNVQSSDLQAFEAHKQSEFHQVAASVEGKYRYCKHCDKEFTSPEQLKEHINGKAHKEQVTRLVARKRPRYENVSSKT
mmetsp:Transcript_22321/g.37343  ORF Transcript_22321/g.37343 Transcript_22321/m.37343 type:complete len:278 (-) Transcript_22321:88-921(-)|eukprot:CAMPEP_0174977438 /NCGR_PEP_ID=MMETSP0004_2-20121128/13603_1 /TAXON_ID=420556 /ORGANISM="Ochromonas sp., Strain CCMP1393" /LENGTH=277 /DNA_ID=CAMNT_0016228609 /DNA_START=37 /DNA_END=870 /DNA_ORIENTATION=+